MYPAKVCSVVLLLGFLTTACYSLPRDPKGTLDQLQHRPLRVGLVENAPWVVRVGNEPDGAEVELVREFAAQLGTTPEWHWGGEQDQFEMLENYGLDLMIGGFSNRTPWKAYVGLTSPYFTETIRVGSRGSQNVKSLKGMSVAVLDDQTAVLVAAEGGQTTRVNSPTEINGLVAGPEWQLQQLNLNQTKIELDSLQHVMAVPPGENALVKRLDEFLYAKRGNIGSLLQQHGEVK
jgi:polar amino acid transport system substrate-binding protein